MYTCKDCGKSGDTSEFTKNAHLYQHPQCKPCRNTYNRERRRLRPDIYLESDRRRRNKLDYKEKHTTASIKWSENNPGHKTLYMRKYREDHPDYVSRAKNRFSSYRERNRSKLLEKQLATQTSKKALIESYKSKACKDCGKQFPPFCMDFDHVRGEKKDNISNMHKNRSIKSILEEIEKCDLVCALCHRFRTQGRLEIQKEETRKKQLERLELEQSYNSSPSLFQNLETTNALEG